MTPQFIVVDLFCGAGGTTTGFEMAGGVAKVIACVNHDPKAIKSHWLNHPEVKHFEEDIRTLDLTDLIHLVNYYRTKYPAAKLILWASLECTNFSKAKGGLPRDADSRTLAESLYMHWDQAKKEYYVGDSYIQLLDPDYIMIENVVEFMSWGPVDEKGKPVSRKNGQDWLRWRNEICSIGYRDDWKQMNSADFGAYTSRNRLFGIFAKYDLPLSWPIPTHSKKPMKGGIFGDLKKWKAVKEVLDFEDEGMSIFNRKKPLVDASLDRIYAGLVKFVAGGKGAFILKYNSVSSNGKHIPPSVDDPCPTIACQNRIGVVNTSFIAKYYSGKPGNHIKSLDHPADSLTCIDHHSIVNVKSFLAKYHGGHTSTTDAPCPVIVARQDKAPLYLIQFVIDPEVCIPVYEDDSEVMIRIKQFMAIYGISDIKMRMLKVPELLKIQGFPDGYILEGNQADQKKFIGNSVVPDVVKHWILALASNYIKQVA